MAEALIVSWNPLTLLADQVLLVALSVGLAALIRAFTGFGFAMLVVPAFSLFLLPGDAVVLSARRGRTFSAHVAARVRVLFAAAIGEGRASRVRSAPPPPA